MGSAMSDMFDYSIQHLAFEAPVKSYSELENINFVTTITGDRIATRCIGPQGRPYLRGNAAADSSRFVIFSHGNADDIGTAEEYMYWFATTFSCNVMTYDYVNYGCSSRGKTNEANMHSAVMAVFEYVTMPEYDGGLGVTHDRIMLIGKSLGTAPTVYLASHLATTECQQRINGVILMSPLASGVRALAPVGMASKRILDVLDSMFCPSLDLVKKIRVPVFIIHGYEDKVINIVNARILAHNLHEDASYTPLFVHAGHNDIEATHPLTMKEYINAFYMHCDTVAKYGRNGHLVDYLDDFD